MLQKCENNEIFHGSLFKETLFCIDWLLESSFSNHDFLPQGQCSLKDHFPIWIVWGSTRMLSMFEASWECIRPSDTACMVNCNTCPSYCLAYLTLWVTDTGFHNLPKSWYWLSPKSWCRLLPKYTGLNLTYFNSLPEVNNAPRFWVRPKSHGLKYAHFNNLLSWSQFHHFNKAKNAPGFWLLSKSSGLNFTHFNGKTFSAFIKANYLPGSWLSPIFENPPIHFICCH